MLNEICDDLGLSLEARDANKVEVCDLIVVMYCAISALFRVVEHPYFHQLPDIPL